MTDQRPDPDALLERVRAEEARAGRGGLRIFFGYAAGVGKTYAMLEAARRAVAAGREGDGKRRDRGQGTSHRRPPRPSSKSDLAW